MQLTIDVDKHFIENLKEEFHTTNIKDALSQLFDFYKHAHTLEEIKVNDNDYPFIQDARVRRQDGEKTYSVDSVIDEYKWLLRFKNQLKKILRKIDKKQALKILEDIKSLENYPDISNIKKLKKHYPPMRYRIGNYRVLFDIKTTL